MADKKSFIFYFDWADAWEDLTDAEIGQLMKAIVKFASTGEKTTFRSRAMKIIFKLLSADILRDVEKYEDMIEKRRESGKKGGQTRAKQMLASASKAKQSQANQADNVNVNDNDNDNDNEGEGVNKVLGAPSQDEAVAFFQEQGFRSSPTVFWNYYEAKGWKINGDPVHNWKSLARNWEEREVKKPKEDGYSYDREAKNFD